MTYVPIFKIEEVIKKPVETKIKRILSYITLIDIDKINLDDSISDKLQMCFYLFMDAVMDIEEEFDIDIEDKDLKSFITVQDIVNYVKNQQGGNNEGLV